VFLSFENTGQFELQRRRRTPGNKDHVRSVSADQLVELLAAPPAESVSDEDAVWEGLQ
jgi:hypothetical protein